MDYTQAKSTLIAHSHVQHPASIQGTTVNVAGAISCLITMWHALIEATVNTNPGAFRIFGSHDAAGDDAWFHITDIDVNADTSTHEPVSTSEAAGSKVIGAANTTGYVAKDNIYVRDTNGAAPTTTTGSLSTPETLSEWHTIQRVVANTSVDLMIGLLNAKDTSDEMWTLARQFNFSMSCAGLSRIRVDFSHEGAVGANVHVKAEVTVATDIE